MLRNPTFCLLLLLLPFFSNAQIFIGFANADSTGFVKDSIRTTSQRPDEDRNDIPFIDYKPAVILNTPNDSVYDYAYIRKNFTDQMVSVWSYPKRLYPASRIYGLDMDGKHYRSVKVAYQNYVLAEQLIEGEMDLYLYRKIPQVNGWIEFIGHDSLRTGYRNYMIVEQHEMRGKQDYFGYFVSIGDDSLRPVNTAKFQSFIDTYLNESPGAKAKAEIYAGKNNNRKNKIAIVSLMSIGIVGLAFTGGTAASLIFLAGFPAAALVAYINRPHTLHWEDMVEIVNTYNSESAVKK